MLTRFCRDIRGNVAMMAGLMVVLLFVLGGGAVDFIRFATVRSEMQSAADSAVLAAASFSNNGAPTAVATEYFNNNFDPDKFNVTNVVFTPSLDKDTTFIREVSATVTADMPTFFLGILDFIDKSGKGESFKNLTVGISSRAAESEQNVEIAVVLDISGSMSGTKIDNLRNAGEAFINKVFDDASPRQTSLSIIPFSSNVNIEPIFTDYADPATFTDPTLKPCVIYDDADLTSQRITTLRPATDPALSDSRNLCTTSPVLLNSENRTDLINAVQSLTAGGRTDAHLGLMWGAKALSPTMRGFLGGDFNGRPAAYTRRTIKVLIVMTDGIINPLLDADGTHPVTESTTQFGALCDEAKANGIVVFSIGFDIASPSDPDTMLSTCASTLSQYYFVEGLDISTAFDSIAASISALRVTE